MVRVGDYELERQVGSGASGTVWLARRPGPVARVAAVKRLRAGAGSLDVDRARREAHLLTELDHPHVVGMIDVVHDGDGIALVMQYAPGGSLDDLLAGRGRLSPGEVVAVAAPLADALASAHRRGVVHGDVKPANVLFTSDGEPLLTDFGAARALGVTSDQVAGTAGYIAPELLDGGRPDARADVYSLGVACYQALAGRPPFGGDTPPAVARAADGGEHRPVGEVADVPDRLAAVVEQAINRDPGRRFASAEGFALALRASVPQAEARLPGPATHPLAAGFGEGADGLGGSGGGAAGRQGAREPGGAHDRHGPAGETRTFGPRPPRPAEPPAAPPRFRLRRLVALGALGAVGAGALWLARSGTGPGCDAAPGSGGAEAAETEADLVVVGDVDGDGCEVQGVYGPRAGDGAARMVLTIRLGGTRKQFGLGQRGDQVVLGDWDCDGDDTPALYRQAAGAVEYYGAWPAVADRAYEPDRTEIVPIGGSASRRAAPGEGCDRVTIAGGRLPGGP